MGVLRIWALLFGVDTRVARDSWKLPNIGSTRKYVKQLAFSALFRGSGLEYVTQSYLGPEQLPRICRGMVFEVLARPGSPVQAPYSPGDALYCAVNHPVGVLI